MANDIEQRLAAMTDGERSAILLSLITAMPNPNKCHDILRDHDLLDDARNNHGQDELDESMDGDDETGVCRVWYR